MTAIKQEVSDFGPTAALQNFIDRIDPKQYLNVGISEQALTYSEVLKNLNEQLLTAQATGEQEKIDQILQQISQTQNLLNTVLGGTSTGASNVVAYKPQN